MPRLDPPLLITFSGLDGSGKSTQIENLCRLAEANRLRVVKLAFWDDVVVLARYREGFVHQVFKSERGVGAPGKPVNRRDKNQRGWHLDLARRLLYLLDALNLSRVVAGARRRAPDLIVMDRFIYDELANLPLSHPLGRAWVRALAGIAPQPDLAYLLDADPEAARARKPEYPVDFMAINRRNYHQLARMLGRMCMVPPLDLPQAQRVVEDAFLDVLQRRSAARLAVEPAA